jgi:hypothetical protein
MLPGTSPPSAPTSSRRPGLPINPSVPQALFLAKESDLNKAASSTENNQQDPQSNVQTLADALDTAFRSEECMPAEKHGVNAGSESNTDTMPHLIPMASKPVIDAFIHPTKSSPKPSPFSTPLNTGSPAPDFWNSAIPSTPKSGSFSLRLSDGESQMGVEDSEHGSPEEDNQPTAVDSQPELVMPSLAMPDRRPFTDRGRSIGRLRICIAGRQGVWS